MTNTRASSRWSLGLGRIGGLLAIAAAAISYAKGNGIRWELIGAGIFFVLLANATRVRRA